MRGYLARSGDETQRRYFHLKDDFGQFGTQPSAMNVRRVECLILKMWHNVSWNYTKAEFIRGRIQSPTFAFYKCLRVIVCLTWMPYGFRKKNVMLNSELPALGSGERVERARVELLGRGPPGDDSGLAEGLGVAAPTHAHHSLHLRLRGLPRVLLGVAHDLALAQHDPGQGSWSRAEQERRRSQEEVICGAYQSSALAFLRRALLLLRLRSRGVAHRSRRRVVPGVERWTD